MPSLGDSDRRVLLKIARTAVTEAVTQHREINWDQHIPQALRNPAGAFVTLWKNKKLRGCIGQMEPEESLAQVVAHCAFSAALEDYRFDPVVAEELPQLEIEISVLCKPFPIAAEQIKAGEHGLIVSRGSHRGVLLPQVAAEHGWSAERLLDETCLKARLPRGAWREPQTRIEGFTAGSFFESQFSDPPKSGHA